MSKVKVCMVVPNTMVKGGIAAVVNGYRGSKLEQDYEITYVESYIDGSKFKKFMKAICGYFIFLKVLLFNRPNIVHIHSSFGPSFYRKLPFIYLAFWFKIPIINHIHGADFDEFYISASKRKKEKIKRVYDKCDYLIALSDEWKERLSQIVPKEHIVIIENYSTIHKDALEDRLKRNVNNKVLFLGEIGERKGCFDIPSVVELVVRSIPDVQFILAGSGSEEDENKVKTLLREKKVDQNVSFPGWVRDEEKDKLLRESDLFFLPSYNEGMPMSVLDAMGYGLPVVSTNVGGIPKIVINGKNGYCCSPGDVENLAKHITGILENENLRFSFCKESMEIAFNKFSLTNHIDHITKLYKILIESSC